MRIIGKKIIFRLAEIEDAEFIVSMRQNDKNKFLAEVDINDQIKWLRKYKEREFDKSEYYFVICTNYNEPCGAVRIYELVIKFDSTTYSRY
jgi:hypothetical protein